MQSKSSMKCFSFSKCLWRGIRLKGFLKRVWKVFWKVFLITSWEGMEMISFSLGPAHCFTPFCPTNFWMGFSFLQPLLVDSSECQTTVDFNSALWGNQTESADGAAQVILAFSWEWNPGRLLIFSNLMSEHPPYWYHLCDLKRVIIENLHYTMFHIIEKQPSLVFLKFGLLFFF